MKKAMSGHKKFFRNVGLLTMLGLLLGFFGGGAGAKSDSYIRNRVVKLQSSRGSCSGEQVRAPSGQSYILTAGHCRALEDASGSIEVVLDNKKTLMRKVIAEDKFSDLLLLEGLPNVDGLELAKEWRPNQDVITYTHGRGFDTYTTRGLLVQYEDILINAGSIQTAEDQQHCESMPKFKTMGGWFGSVCVLQVTEVVTTAAIVPGSSGGAVLDSNGDMVGVVSAGDGQGGLFGYLVPLHDMRRFLSGY